MTRLSVQIEGTIGDLALQVAFEHEAGVLALWGPSGSGKTTTLRAIAGLWRPKQGRIVLDEKPLFDSENHLWERPEHRNIGFVFQEPRLFPHMSVQGNLLYSGKEQKGQFDRIVDMLDLGDSLTQSPSTLSGGEAQRVSIGRVLLSNPQLLILDEPMTGLDEARQEQIFPYLLALKNEMNLPMIYVSHRRQEINQIADATVYIENGQTEKRGTEPS